MRRTSAGFALLELMVALTVLSVALLALMAGICHCIGQSQVLQEYNLALAAAQATLEEMQEVAGDDLSQVEPSFNVDPNDDPDGPATAPGNAFRVDGLLVQDADADGLHGVIEIDSTDPDLLDVTVRIEWQGPTGEAQDVELQTLLTHQ